MSAGNTFEKPSRGGWKTRGYLSATSKTEELFALQKEKEKKNPRSLHTGWMFPAMPEEKVLNSVWAGRSIIAHQLVNGKYMTSVGEWDFNWTLYATACNGRVKKGREKKK